MLGRALAVGLVLPGCLSRPEPSAASAITYVGVFVAEENPPTFNAHAQAIGDAVVIHVSCDASDLMAPPLAIMGPTNWTIVQIGEGGEPNFWAASFGAIAPDINNDEFEVVTPGCNASVMGDEFAGTDGGGGSATFDGHAEAHGSGACEAILRANHDDDAIWGGCTVAGLIDSAGTGFTSHATVAGNATEFRISTDAAGTVEQVPFANSGEFVITAVTLKPL